MAGGADSCHGQTDIAGVKKNGVFILPGIGRAIVVNSHAPSGEHRNKANLTFTPSSAFRRFGLSTVRCVQLRAIPSSAIIPHMTGLGRTVAIVLALSLLLFAGDKYAVYPGTLTDFSEEPTVGSRVQEPGSGPGSCVDRNYTIDIQTRLLVLQQRICDPDSNPPPPVEIGQDVNVVLDLKDHNRAGLILGGGKTKPIWMQLFKSVKS